MTQPCYKDDHWSEAACSAMVVPLLGEVAMLRDVVRYLAADDDALMRNITLDLQLAHVAAVRRALGDEAT